MNAIILGPAEVAQTLAMVLERRGVTVNDRIDSTLSLARNLRQRGDASPELFLLIAGDDPIETKAILAELHHDPTARVIVCGVGKSAMEVVQYIRSGATDYIDMSGDFLRDAEDVLKRLADPNDAEISRGRIVSVLSSNGGAGKTAVAVNLATSLAKEQQAKTILVDLNFSGGDVASHMGLTPQRSLLDCPQIISEIHSVAILPLVEKHASGLHVLAAPDYLGNHGALHPEVIKAVLSTLARLYEYVVLDLEDVYHKEQAAAIEMSDSMLVVCRSDFPSLMRTMRLQEYLYKLNPCELRFVMNSTVRGVSIPDSKVEAVLKNRIEASMVYEPATVLNAINMGEPAVLEFPRSKFSRSISKLATQLHCKAICGE